MTTASEKRVLVTERVLAAAMSKALVPLREFVADPAKRTGAPVAEWTERENTARRVLIAEVFAAPELSPPMCCVVVKLRGVRTGCGSEATRFERHFGYCDAHGSVYIDASESVDKAAPTMIVTTDTAGNPVGLELWPDEPVRERGPR